MQHLKHILESTRWLLFAGALLCAELAVAMPTSLAPPQPAANKNTPAVWVGILVMLVIVGVILTISLMPSRRSHQD
ncbi:MAG: hypothetical protein VX727_08210 [Planctomycetota bacterium]|nr:hypothetical protein [Planctomycetota bacterium]